MKHIILSILVSAFALGASAQDMAPLFAAMPDQYIPQLESAWRKDLIELYNSGKEPKLKNNMNGYSSLSKLTSDYMLLQSTERSTIEMKLLPLVNNTHVLCVVTTVNGPIADSHVDFFTTDWQPLNAADMYTPVSAEWFIKDDVDKNAPTFLDASASLDMELIKYTLSPENLTLTATYTTPEYLNKEDRDKITSYLKESPKVLNWEKFHFK